MKNSVVVGVAVAMALFVLASVSVAASVGTVSAQEDSGGDSNSNESLDLAEANVMEVEYSASGSGAYGFDVTLYHDDSGEEAYANWWQVETTGGERLGRRDLLHAHGTREFTRSETVEVPMGTRYVVVRGHDETHGYGGRAAVVDLESGDVEFVDQGNEAQSFSGYSGSKTEKNSNRTESGSASKPESESETESQPQPGFSVSALASVFLMALIRRLLWNR
ncbi:hypothetical protein ACEU6E_06655 [Halorutilales archaeon Cl-col2-1]